jgi:hypothetical protein
VLGICLGESSGASEGAGWLELASLLIPGRLPGSGGGLSVTVGAELFIVDELSGVCSSSTVGFRGVLLGTFGGCSMFPTLLVGNSIGSAGSS